MPQDWTTQLAQVLGSVGGLRGGSNAFAQRWAELEEMDQRRKQQQAELASTQEDRDLRRQQMASSEQRAKSAEERAQQDQTLQVVGSFRDLLGDETITNQEEYDKRHAIATWAAQKVGVDTGFVDSLRPTPTTLQRRQASEQLKKIYAKPEIRAALDRGDNIDSLIWELPSIGANPARDGMPIWTVADLETLTQAPRPAQPLPKPKAKAATPGSFEHYVDAPPEEQARIEDARKRYMQADDRPPAGADPEVAELRKALLRLQVDRAGDEKEPNQGQFTAATYAGRMEQAERIFGDVQNDIVTMRLPAFELQTNSWFARPTFQAAAVQSYMQAARNFINAVLRRESGAVISPSEFSEARQQYLPQPGDTPEALAQKAENRRYVFATMKRAAGRAYEAPPTVYPPLTKDSKVGGTYMHNGKKVNVSEKTRTGFLFDEVP